VRGALAGLAFLRPSYSKVLLFAVLAITCFFGSIQTFAFIDDIPGVPKPPLYDEVRCVELWFPWVALSLPIHLAGWALRLWNLAKYLPSLSLGVKVPLISIAYSYALSCWTVSSWGRWLRSLRSRVAALSIGVGSSLVLVPLPLLLTYHASDPCLTLRSCSGFALILLVSTVYIVSIYGLARALAGLVRRARG